MTPSGVDRNAVGVYTKTVIRSPVVRWILHGRIRHQRLNDVIFVGDNWIQVKQVVTEGHLQDIATKDDFDGHIRAAAMFSNEEDDFLATVRTEHDATHLEDGEIPPQSIVLTLDSNDMLFLFISTDSTGVARFVHQSVPILGFDQMLFQPGEHIAVDHQSRAVAVAANEKHVVVYTAKPQDQIKRELRQREVNWLPIVAFRQLEVTGVIQHMDFLMPPEDDKEHVILLLIVIDQRRTKAVWYDWYVSADPRTQAVQVHPGQPLAVASTVPSMLIPLVNAAFILITDNEMTIWQNILSGSVTDQALNPPADVPMYPGISSHNPVWASWTRAPRVKRVRRERDFLYLVREDGLVYYFTISQTLGVQICRAGDFQCHVGSAFTSIGDESDPEQLVVAGENSGGCVVRLGLWPSLRSRPDISREEAMEMQTVEFLPNWASATDMIAAKSVQTSRGHNKDDDTTLITSGRQPHGSLTELRNGIEAQLAASIPIAGIRTVTDIWTVPDLEGDIALIMSSPSATRIMRIGHDAEEFEDCGDTSAFDTTRRSLVVGMANAQLVQITTEGICVTSTLSGNFEDTTKEVFGEGISAVVATIVPERFLALTIERRGDDHGIVSRSIPPPGSDSEIERQSLAAFEGSPTCLTSAPVEDGIVVLTSDTMGSITAMLFRDGGLPVVRHVVTLSNTMDQPAICDHMVILRSTSDTEGPFKLLLVCGLRDGKITSFAINQHSDVLLAEEEVFDLGFSTVKLTHLTADSSTACAMTGISTYLLSWNRTSAKPLSIENLWLADMADRNLAQTPITACTQVPSSVHLKSDTLADSLVMVSGECALVASLGSTVTTVARQTAVSGTPNRLIYAESLRCVVCASVYTEVHYFPSPMPHSPPEEKRQIWPTLTFIPSNVGIPSFRHDMEPGERVYALLELSISRNSDKKHTWILVGGEYVRTNGSRRGRITFIQPVSQNWQVTKITEKKHTVTFHDPVYSMALYDSTTYVACSGEEVYINRLHVSDMKWDQLCEPYKMGSRGVHVSVETDRSNRRVIVVSTQRDSFVTLRLEKDDTTLSLVPISMGPRAHNSLSHLVLPPTTDPYSTMEIDQFTLLATRDCHLVGLASPITPQDSTMQYTSAETVFDAELPRSLTRLIPSKPAARKGPPPQGVSYRITACATDGTLYGVLLIEGKLSRRLFWLQRLIEWSRELSPHTWHEAPYNLVDDDRYADEQRPREVPVGLGDGVTKVLLTNTCRENDMHIDADVLKRGLGVTGQREIVKVIEELAQRSDVVSSWLMQHLDEEIAALADLLVTVRQLDDWA